MSQNEVTNTYDASIFALIDEKTSGRCQVYYTEEKYMVLRLNSHHKTH